MACQRTARVGVVRAALNGCIAPRLGPNVCLAGKPRVVAKLHRPWPGGGALPARANSSLVPRGVETTAPTLATPAVTMWTRPSDRAPSYGPCGQGLDKCCALAHPLFTLAALAPTSSPLQQQRSIRKGDGTGSRRLPDSSVIPSSPSTEQSGQIAWASHERKREKTGGWPMRTRYSLASLHPSTP